MDWRYATIAIGLARAATARSPLAATRRACDSNSLQRPSRQGQCRQTEAAGDNCCPAATDVPGKPRRFGNQSVVVDGEAGSWMYDERVEKIKERNADCSRSTPVHPRLRRDDESRSVHGYPTSAPGSVVTGYPLEARADVLGRSRCVVRRASPDPPESTDWRRPRSSGRRHSRIWRSLVSGDEFGRSTRVNGVGGLRPPAAGRNRERPRCVASRVVDIDELVETNGGRLGWTRR